MQRMNETVTYKWTEEIGRSAVTAAHSAKVARFRFMIIGGFILLGSGLWSYLSTGQFGPLLAVVFGIFLILVQIRFYFLYRRLVRDTGTLLEDPTVTVTITDDALTISSDKNTRTIEWSKATRIIEKNGFLLLYCGKLHVAALPAPMLSDNQIQFIKSRIQK